MTPTERRRVALRRKTALRPRCPSGRKKYATKEAADEAFAAVQAVTNSMLSRIVVVRDCGACQGWHLVQAQKPLPRGTGLRPRSAKTAAVYRRERVPLVKELLEDGAACAIRWDANCAGRADTVHEIKKRSRGGSVVDRANTVPACAYCNGKVEDEPIEAHRRGFALHSWERTA